MMRWSTLLCSASVLLACQRPLSLTGSAAPAAPLFSEGEVDVPARLVHMPSPKCPEAARGLGYDGRVVLAYVIGSDGRAEPSSIHVLRSNHFMFEGPAIQAVLRARFSSARKQGQPVRVKNEQRFTFVMGKS